MGSPAVVAIGAVWRALDHCLAGWRKEEKLHHWWVYPPNGGVPYRSFPLGVRGQGDRAEIQMGHVRKLARQFDVSECMDRQLKAR